jgi:hypothetical protein
MFQTFPFEYKCVEPNTQLNLRKIGTHIGNADKVLLGKAIGESIKIHIVDVYNNYQIVTIQHPPSPSAPPQPFTSPPALHQLSSQAVQGSQWTRCLGVYPAFQRPSAPDL